MQNLSHDSAVIKSTIVAIQQHWSQTERMQRAKMARHMTKKLLSLLGIKRESDFLAAMR